MYARVSAKRAKLLTESDYRNLLKMQPNEIARKLEEGEYSEEINDLASDYEGIELIEHALTQNLSNTLCHIYEISPESLENILESYLRRYDILSFKRLLRWKENGNKKNIDALITPTARTSKEKYLKLKQKSLEEIKESIKFPESNIDYQDYLKDTETLQEIEKQLDQAYFDDIIYTASKTRNKYLNKFVQDEIEYENIKIALRLKKYGLAEEKIKEMLLKGDKRNTGSDIAESEDLKQALKLLRDKEIIKPEFEEENLEDIEHLLEVKRLEKALSMLHEQPMGLTSVLGYILAKTIEVKNLRMLIRAKETGIQNNKTIERNLIIPNQ